MNKINNKSKGSVNNLEINIHGIPKILALPLEFLCSDSQPVACSVWLQYVFLPFLFCIWN